MEDKKTPVSNSFFLEFFLWIVLALLVVSRAAFLYWSALISSNESGIESLYYFFFIAILLILFPLLFRQILGFTPMEYLRRHFTSRREFREERLRQRRELYLNSEKKIQVNEPVQEYSRSSEREFITSCIAESKSIADNIYQRSGVYLLVGSLIAFVGVGLFYSPATSYVHVPGDPWYIGYLPRFGTLFFVEFIAFFFLKQYRTMLQEYRYYEGVKRNRQDAFTKLLLIEKFADKPTVIQFIIDNFDKSSSFGKLNKDETTEIIEAQKILQQEPDFISKILELVREAKGK